MLKLLSIVACILYASKSIDAIQLSKTKPLTPSEAYTHSITVDDEDPELYKLFWKHLGDDEIQFEAHCRTTGWVGFGLSHTGGMTGADIAIGWVKDGVGYLKDTHATGFSTPIEDKVQDFELLDAAEFDGYTILKFKRKLNTCDKDHDNEIKHETHYLIFAWNTADPVTGNGDWRYHGSNRRTRVDLLLVYKDETLVEETDDVDHSIAIDFKLNMHAVKPQKTYYYCQFYEVPEFEEPMHMIRYQMLIEKENRDIFHHLVIHECPESTVNSIEPLGLVGYECGMSRVPSFVNRCLESAIIVAWGVGGQTNFSFPKNTGFPTYKSPVKRYFLFEYHFDNPRLDSGRIDNTGIRLFYTNKLREHDLGVIQFTSGYHKLDLAIPPKIEDLVMPSICYPECFNRFAPPGGIKVFSGFMHTHMAGRAVRTKLVRENKVVKYLFENPKYDFNYQFNVEIEPEILRTGDQVILECVYESMDREGMTYFGHSSIDEMCMNFVYYYPRVPNFELCRSTVAPKSLFDFIRQLAKEGLIPPIELSDTNINSSYNMIMAAMNNPAIWTDEVRRRYKEFQVNPGNHLASCGSLNNLAASIVELEKPFSLPFDEVAANNFDKCPKV